MGKLSMKVQTEGER